MFVCLCLFTAYSLGEEEKREKEKEGETGEEEEEKRKSGREEEEKREEEERLSVPSGVSGGARGGLPRRRTRGGGGGGGGGISEKEGRRERKAATSEGEAQRSIGESGVGWRGQSNKCATVCSSRWHSGQALLVVLPSRNWKSLNLEQNPDLNCDRTERVTRGSLRSCLLI